MPRVTIRDVRESQRTGKVILPLGFWWITRPLAWPLTVVFASAGISANQTTLLRAILSFAGLALISIPAQPYFGAGLALYLFTLILDHVDGNLCRLSNTASHFGKLFDGIIDSVSEILLPMALAASVWLAAGSQLVLVAGAVAALSLALTQLVLLRYALARRDVELASQTKADRQRTDHPDVARALAAPGVAQLAAVAELAGPNLLWDLRYAGLVAAAMAGAIGHYLWALAMAQSALLIVLVSVKLLRGYAEFDIHRYSRTAARRSPATGATGQ